MILVIDVGTTGLRAAVVVADATIQHVEYRWFPPDAPFPGLVEFDAAAMARSVVEAAGALLARNPRIVGIGIANQRASTVVWDRATGEPVGPGLGWQERCRVFGKYDGGRGDGRFAHWVPPRPTAWRGQPANSSRGTA